MKEMNGNMLRWGAGFLSASMIGGLLVIGAWVGAQEEKVIDNEEDIKSNEVKIEENRQYISDAVTTVTRLEARQQLILEGQNDIKEILVGQ
jgi:hypothetical protein|tara:strand:- start:197 stop:469 length:273 start_codon:yes stop_codon:yes gene_type:complete